MYHITIGASTCTPQKEAKMKIVFLFITSLLFFTYSTSIIFARHPAVEPVMGLSIDDSPVGNPKNNRGYAFKPNSKQINFEGIRKPAEVRQISILENTDPSPALLVLLMIILPIVTIFVINKRSKRLIDAKDARNTVQLFPNKSDNNNSNDDDFSKAS